MVKNLSLQCNLASFEITENGNNLNVSQYKHKKKKNQCIILQGIIIQTLILNDIYVHMINKGTTIFYMEKKQSNITSFVLFKKTFICIHQYIYRKMSRRTGTQT